MDKTKEFIENYATYLLLGLVFFLFIFIGTTISANSKNSDFVIVNDELRATVSSLENNVKKLKKDIEDLSQEEVQEDIRKKIESLEDEYKSKLSSLDKKHEEEVLKLESNKTSLESEIKTLEDKTASLNEKIDSLNSSIVKISGQPRKFPAGVFYQTSDFPVDRYRISGGNSNFVVRSSTGTLLVNIILGKNGVSEYIYDFSSGDVIDSRSPFTLTPVE